MVRTLAISLLTAALTGCGTVALGGVPVEVGSARVAAGWSLSPVVGAEAAAETWSVIERRSGAWVLAYGRDKLGDRHVYVTTSTDGTHWSAPKVVGKAAYSDQEPALYEDAAGSVHLIFASNRSGQWALYECTSKDGDSWGEPALQDVGVAQPLHPALAALPDGRVGLACESLTEPGHFVLRSATGAWGKAEEVFAAGTAPSLAAGADGTFALAYRSGQAIAWRTRTAAGGWTAATSVGAFSGCGLTTGPSGWWLATLSSAAEGYSLALRAGSGASFEAASPVVSDGADEGNPVPLALRSGERVVAFKDAGGALVLARAAK